MLVGDLAHLLDSGEYRRCLREATIMLSEGGHDEATEARILAAICRSRLELTDYFASADAGRRAATLAESAGLPDLHGFTLIDLSTALARVHRYPDARAGFERFLDKLPDFTAARCMEGTVLQRLAGVLQPLGLPGDALRRYQQARAWFERFGDMKSGWECARAVIRIHLDLDEPHLAVPLLQEGDEYAAEHPGDRNFMVDHLLDRAVFYLTVGRHQDSIREAFQALELADDQLQQQCRAHLLLCRNALAKDQPKDALNFALAARVSAIDGRLYDLEFEASEVLFRILHERGAHLITELEEEYVEQGVDIYHYLPEQLIRRMQRK